MEDFYFYTLVVAVILLIVMLTMIGITMSYKNSLQSFPPTDNKCPDYWEIAPNGYCKYPGSGTGGINYGNKLFYNTSATKLLKEYDGTTKTGVDLVYADNTESNGGNELFARVSYDNDYSHYTGDAGSSVVSATNFATAKSRIDKVANGGAGAGTGNGFLFLKLNNDDDRWQKIETNAYAGLSTRCAKKKWAQKYGLQWDGITNYNGCK